MSDANQSGPPGTQNYQVPPGGQQNHEDGQGQATQVNNQPMQMQVHPMQIQGQPMQMQGQPMQMQGQPMQMQGQPMQMQGQQMPMQGQQMPMQPMPMQGQPMMMQGQYMPVQGQPVAGQMSMQMPAGQFQTVPMQQMTHMTPQQQQQMMMMMQAQVAQNARPIVWMEKPGSFDGCPPGLEYLTQLDQLLVKQQIELMEVFTNIEMNNRYIVKNVLGQQVYFAREESDGCVRQCCGPMRPFTMHIEDNLGQEVIQIQRPYKCVCYAQCCSCHDSCQDEVEIMAPPGETVGFVKQLYEGCNMNYAIQDANKNMVLLIQGPSYFHCHCPGDDIPFTLMSGDGSTEVGRISKQWSNLVREYFTDADNFGIQFPIDLDVRLKAVVLGAVFLIDFMFFERQQNRRG